MSETDLSKLLALFRTGEIDQAALMERLTRSTAPPTGQTAAAQVDLDRLRRCGYPEVVFSQGKTVSAIADIFRMQLAHGQNCLATRVSADQASELLSLFPGAEHNATARTIRLATTGDDGGSGRPKKAGRAGRVAVITAGTGDLPVAEEALETALWMGCDVDLIIDVGVAGPQRLAAQQHRFADADAIVVVAGMEGALPSVVGGHVACPVIAVPTSIGYGASFGGVAALLGMLNSCAANVTVVNIDAGFKGGFVAGLIAQSVARAERSAIRNTHPHGTSPAG